MKYGKLEVVKNNLSVIADIVGSSLEKASELFGESIVVKISGKILSDMERVKEIAKNIVIMKSLGVNVIIVHGGLSAVNQIIEGFENKKTIKNQLFHRSPIETIEMVMTGYISKHIVNMINLHGGNAVGVSGKDGNLIYAKKPKRIKSSAKIENILDVGYLGEISAINPELLFALEDSNLIPVISPIAFSETGDTYHVNSDLLAVEIAKIYSAAKIVFISDHSGLRNVENKQIESISLSQASALGEHEVMNEDLQHKLKCCIAALEDGIEEAHIFSGLVPNGLLIELFTNENIGTRIINK
jgi:acetylglutamate kinase